MFVSHPPNAYDLFLTAAVGDGIKLWDLRTNKCVRRYDGHVNRSQPVGVAISPCARFIATGSEDRSVSLDPLMCSLEFGRALVMKMFVRVKRMEVLQCHLKNS